MKCIVGVALGLLTLHSLRVVRRLLPYLVTSGSAEAAMRRIHPTDAGHVLVTGATDGVGREMARCLNRLGYSLILHGRSDAKLNALKQEMPDVVTIIEDLTQGSQILVETIETYQISRIINCAGVTRLEEFSSHNPRDITHLLRLNVESLSLLLNKCLKSSSKKILFVNVCSMAALSSFPYIALYGATKTFQAQLLQNVQEENPSTQILNVCPWFIETKMTAFRKSWDSEDPSTIASNMVKLIASQRHFGVGSPKHELLSLHLPLLMRSFISRLKSDCEIVVRMKTRRRRE